MAKQWFVYVADILEYPHRIKIGHTYSVPNRLSSLNDKPNYTLRALHVIPGFKSKDAADHYEKRLQAAYSEFGIEGFKEYFDVGVAEIAKIRKDKGRLRARLESAEKSAPGSVADCIKLRLVVLKATVYKNYCQRNGKEGLGIEVFEAEMKRLGAKVPDEAVTINSSPGQAAWSGYATILPGASGIVSKMVVNEVRAINRRKPHGKISKIKPPKKDGSILTISCEAFKYLAPLVWPA